MPIDSLYQATKSSIQRGLFELQQKIRRVKISITQKKQVQLEREITQNLRRQQNAYRRQSQLIQLQRAYYQQQKFNNLLQRTSCDPYVNSILYESIKNDPADLGYTQLKQAIRRETQHLEHLKRLEMMRQDKQLFEKRNLLNYSMGQPSSNLYQQESNRKNADNETNLISYSSPIRDFQNSAVSQFRHQNQNQSPQKQSNSYNRIQYDMPIEQDSSALIDKYNKGIRAEQYNRDMQRLVEIQKRLRKIQENSAQKPNYLQDNESIVTKYQHHQQNRSLQGTGRKNQENLLVHNQVVDQRKVNANLNKNVEQDQVKKLEKKVEMFQNQKIGQVINKRPVQKQELSPLQQLAKNKGLDALQKYVKNPQPRNPLLKNATLSRPTTGKQRRHQISNTSSVSPLKSDRPHTHNPNYPKSKRPRAKSSKQNTSRTRNNVSFTNQANVQSRLLPLDPQMQKVVENIIQNHVNDKIKYGVKLSSCVFKDAKLRNEKTQIIDLSHRFQLETKLRKQVKRLINNDPIVLRKHKMVVE